MEVENLRRKNYNLKLRLMEGRYNNRKMSNATSGAKMG
jgi:hypothetical protein